MVIPRLLLHPVYGALTVAAIWGLNVVVMKIAMADLPPLAFTTLRFCALALLLWPFVKISWPQFRQSLPLALTMGMGHFYMLALGLTYVPGVIASLCLLLGAPFSSILGYLILKEHLTMRQVMAITIATLGALIPTLASGNISLQIGMLIVIFSTFMWAYGNIQVKQMQQISTMAIQFWIAVITAPISYGFYVYTADGVALTEHITLQAMACLAYVVVFSSIIGYALWYRLIHRHGVQQVAPYALVQPIFTLMAGYLILAEVLSLWQWLGSSITLMAIYLYYHYQRPNQ
ncbi:MAG: EamA family transporter [Gammaproteobacteria bacterium]|nr:EamA family transporter [Gammaproteobacteria bacterium]MCP4880105.1 EamA family transporter [Gammaproteobacteria bacterium]MDP6164699.1 EamA family transporter [Gammaproteobacteria bacterium]